MKSVLLCAALCLAFALNGLAQGTSADAPATKEDVKKYLQAIHSRDMMLNLTGAMSRPMQQMIHEQYLKEKEKLPPNFEARMNKMVDELLKGMPFDEMVEATIPAYQKHFTKGDIDGLVAFCSSPTGQKLLRELPAVTAETMQAMTPIIRQHMEVVNRRVQQEVADIKAAEEKLGKVTPDPQK